jgi:hypothetical protein
MLCPRDGVGLGLQWGNAGAGVQTIDPASPSVDINAARRTYNAHVAEVSQKRPQLATEEVGRITPATSYRTTQHRATRREFRPNVA